MKKILSFALAVTMTASFALTALADDFSSEFVSGKSAWTVSASSTRANYPLSRAFDGDVNSYWHSNYTDNGKEILSHDNCPFDIDITLPEPTVISGMCYTPRQDGKTGIVSAYEVYASESETGELKLVATGMLAIDNAQKAIRFTGNISVKKVKFRIVKGDGDYGTCAELDLLKKSDSLSYSSVDALSSAANSEKVTIISNQGMTATASSEWTEQSMLGARVVDGSQRSAWHSQPTEKDKFPVTLTVDLAKVSSFSSILYYPRIDDNSMNGIWKDYNIDISTDGKSYTSIKKNAALEEKLDIQTIDMGKEVSARYVKFTINAARAGYVTCGELSFLSGSSEAIANQASNATTASGTTQTQTQTQTQAQTQTQTQTQAGKAELISKSGWEISASSIFGSKSPNLAIDGNKSTYWHSNYLEDAGTITSKDELPFYLTITLPEKTVISGLVYTPRNDNYTGIAMGYNIYVSDIDSGEASLIKSGDLLENYDVKTIDFGFNVAVKTLIFEFTKSSNGYGTCAELDLISANGSAVKGISEVSTETTIEIGKNEVKDKGVAMISAKDLVGNKKDWSIVASSARSNYPATRAIDEDTSTYWHSNYTDDGKATVLSHELPPYTLDVTFPESTLISGFCYTPRTNTTGMVSKYALYGATSDDSEWKIISEGEFEITTTRKVVKFVQNISLKKVRFEVIEGVNGYGVCAELDFLRENSNLSTSYDIDEFSKFTDENKLVEISNAKFTAEASSVWRLGNNAMMVVDGVAKSAWHSHPDERNKFPVTLDIDMANVYTFSQIQYVPRQEDASMNGIWRKFNIWTSTDGENFDLIKENLALNITMETQVIDFDKPVTARYVEFEILEGTNGYATCGEIKFYQRKADSALNSSVSKKYILQIGSNIVKTVVDGVTTETQMDVAPYIDNGSTLIPIRGLLEQMGATFKWEDEHQKIDIDCDKVTINMQIFNNLVYVSNIKYGLVRYTLNVPPQITNSRTFVPVRFISENLGYTVDWDGETQTITIY